MTPFLIHSSQSLKFRKICFVFFWDETVNPPLVNWKRKRGNVRVEKEYCGTNWDEEHWNKRTRAKEMYSIKETFHSFQSESAQLFRE